jgi:hypothetical protein
MERHGGLKDCFNGLEESMNQKSGTGPLKATIDHPVMTGRDGAVDHAAKLEEIAETAPRSGTVRLEDGDEATLQYLGAALVLQWQLLPEPAQRAILQKATEIGGLPAIPSLREELKRLIKTNQ